MSSRVKRVRRIPQRKTNGVAMNPATNPIPITFAAVSERG